MLTLLWDTFLSFVVLWSLGAAAAAKLDVFKPWTLLLVTALSGLVSVSVWRRKLPQKTFPWREGLTLLALIVLGIGLLAQPAEHYPLVSESAIYPNNAVILARTGSFRTTFDPLQGLTEAQKTLFYLPVERQMEVTESSYQGMVNGVFYVVSALHNTISASRQPVVLVWMALTVLLFGPQASLWAAPAFGILGVLALYFWGRRAFNPRVGAIAALCLLLSFPQLYFSRAPYSEIFGQVFMLGMLYAWTSYLRTRKVWYLVLGNAALAAAFSARIDSILGLGTLAFLFLLLLWNRDYRGLWVNALASVASVVLAIALWNFPYVSATFEILFYYQLSFLRDFPLPWLVGVGALLVVGAGALLWYRESIIGCVPALQGFCSRIVRTWVPIVRWVAVAGLLLLVGYALFIRPLSPEFIELNGQWYRTYDEELLAVAARYLTPVLTCLAALGMAWIIQHRSPHAAWLLSLVFALSFSMLMFWKYTTSARVYPVALRRLVSDVVPGICLMGAVAMDWLRSLWRPWSDRIIAALACGIVMALFLVCPKYWFYHEGAGTWDLIREMSSTIPENAIVLFEPQEEDRVVSWFATPLWAFEGRQTLVLHPWFAEDLGDLEQVICTWQGMDREVYLMAQRDPETWWFLENVPPEAVVQYTWNSSLVGHAREFPPVFWHFAFEFRLYRLQGLCTG